MGSPDTKSFMHMGHLQGRKANLDILRNAQVVRVLRSHSNVCICSTEKAEVLFYKSQKARKLGK